MAILSSAGLVTIVLSAVLLSRMAGIGGFLAAIGACVVAWLLTAAAILHLARGDWFLPMAAHCAWGLAGAVVLFGTLPVPVAARVVLALVPAAVHIAVLCNAHSLLLPASGAPALLAVVLLAYGNGVYMEKENQAYAVRKSAEDQRSDEAAVATRARLEALPPDATLESFFAVTHRQSTLESVCQAAVAVAIARFPDLDARLAAAVPAGPESRYDVLRFLTQANAPHTDATARIASDAISGLAADFASRAVDLNEDQLAMLAAEAATAFPAHRAVLRPALAEVRRVVGPPQKTERGVISGRQQLEALLR